VGGYINWVVEVLRYCCNCHLVDPLGSAREVALMYGSVVLRPDQESAVWLFVGPPRSGKSYHAVSVILRWVRLGGRVVTNIVFTESVRGVTVVSDDELSPSKFLDTVERVRLASLSSGLLVVIDEASVYWDSREWARVGSEVRGWLATVGHRAVSVVVIGQSVSMIDTTFRRLARYLVEHTDATGGVLGLFTSDVRRWRLFEGLDESWTTLRERGWFFVGPGLPYRSAEVYRGSVVSGFGIRLFGVLFLLGVVFFGVVYGGRYAVVLRGLVHGRFSSFGSLPSGVSYPDPFGGTVRVCGVTGDGLLVEDSSGRFVVVPGVHDDSFVGQSVTVARLLAARSRGSKNGNVKEKK
jgi:hypothetical protein